MVCFIQLVKSRLSSLRMYPSWSAVLTSTQPGMSLPDHLTWDAGSSYAKEKAIQKSFKLAGTRKEVRKYIETIIFLEKLGLSECLLWLLRSFKILRVHFWIQFWNNRWPWVEDNCVYFNYHPNNRTWHQYWSPKQSFEPKFETIIWNPQVILSNDCGLSSSNQCHCWYSHNDWVVIIPDFFRGYYIHKNIIL